MTDPLLALRSVIAEIVRDELAKMKPTAPDEFMTVLAASDFASVHPGTVRRWVRDGHLDEHRAGRSLRVKRSDLERLLKDGAKKRCDETPEAWARRKFG